MHPPTIVTIEESSPDLEAGRPPVDLEAGKPTPEMPGAYGMMPGMMPQMPALPDRDCRCKEFRKKARMRLLVIVLLVVLVLVLLGLLAYFFIQQHRAFLLIEQKKVL